VALVLAVLEKRVGLKVGQHEAYFKVVGGLELEEPAADLAVAVAAASALRDVPVDSGCVLAGEVGLGGELRGIPHALARVAEASRYGFRRFLLPRENALEVRGQVEGVEIKGLSTLREAVEVAIGA
jgi:DNA repair protein RadA/Sms